MTRGPTTRVNPAEARLKKDRAFMEHCGDWPRWPTLPVKLRSGDSHDKNYCGFLFSDGRPIVYLGSLFQLASKSKEARVWHDVLKRCETRTYENLDALAAEWTVD